MARRLPALKAEAKTVKAMKTPAAKAKGMKPETNTMKAMQTPAAKAKGMKTETKTMKAMKTPAAKAKGMKPKTQPLAGMKTPAAKAKEMKPDRQTEIIIDGLIRLTSPLAACEILRCLLDDPVPDVSSISTTTESSRCAIIERAR